MSDKVELSTFPSNRCSALAILYVEKTTNADSTPEEFAEKYIEGYKRIETRLVELRNWDGTVKVLK
jgi:hypothetical protein